MKRGCLVTLIAGGAALAAAVTSACPACAERSFTRLTSHVSMEPVLRTTIDVRARVLDPDRLRSDPTTRGRLSFSYLAWLPDASSTSVELDPRPLLRILIGRQLVAEDGFNLYFMRGSHVLTAELGSTRIGIAPNGFSLRNGTTLTLAAVF
jgi:hypothetical protein